MRQVETADDRARRILAGVELGGAGGLMAALIEAEQPMPRSWTEDERQEVLEVRRRLRIRLAHEENFADTG